MATPRDEYEKALRLEQEAKELLQKRQDDLQALENPNNQGFSAMLNEKASENLANHVTESLDDVASNTLNEPVNETPIPPPAVAQTNDKKNEKDATSPAMPKPVSVTPAPKSTDEQTEETHIGKGAPTTQEQDAHSRLIDEGWEPTKEKIRIKNADKKQDKAPELTDAISHTRHPNLPKPKFTEDERKKFDEFLTDQNEKNRENNKAPLTPRQIDILERIAAVLMIPEGPALINELLNRNDENDKDLEAQLGEIEEAIFGTDTPTETIQVGATDNAIELMDRMCATDGFISLAELNELNEQNNMKPGGP